MASNVDMTGFRTDQFLYDRPDEDQESLPGFKTDAPLYGGGDDGDVVGDWGNFINEVTQYGSTLDTSSRDLIDGVRLLYGDAYDKGYSVTRDLLASDDPVQKYLKDEGSMLSQIFKGAKESYGGLDNEGKKFMWNTLTGLLNYNTVSSLRKNQTKMADAAMMNAQTNAGTLRNKIDQQASTGQMRFNQPRGLIYQNLAETKGVKPMGSA